MFGLVIISAAVSGPTALAQRLDVDVAARVGRDRDDLEAGHRRGGRIGAVRGVGNEHLGARGVAALEVIGASDQHAGQFAVRAGGRLQRDRREAGDLARARPAARTSAPARPGRLLGSW